MKVCLLTAEFPPRIGGLGDYTHLLATALTEEGVEPVVLTSASKDVHDERPYAVRRSVPAWDFGVFPTIEQALRELSSDILHIQYQTGAFGMHPAINLLPRWLSWRKSKAHVVTTFHDLRHPYLFPKAGPVRSWATRQLTKHSDAVITTNAEDEAVLRRWMPDDRLRLIPIGSNIPACGASPESAAAIRQRFEIAPDERLLAFFGMVHPTKGVDTLFRALAQTDVSLLMIADQATSDASRVHELVDSFGVAERIRWTGFIPPDDVAAALAAADCVVLPFTEGVSYRHGTLIAALAAGRPLVTTRPSFAEQSLLPALVPGLNCRMVSPGNADELALAIRMLLSDPDEMERLSLGARQLSQAFEWPAIARQTAQLYREVMAA